MLLTILLAIVIVALMIGINALYVAGEFATVGARKSRLIQLSREGSRLAKMLLPVVEDTHRLDNYIAASQVGITLSSIVLGIYGQQQIAPLIQPLVERVPLVGEAAAAGASALIVLFFLTALQVVLGELVPKSIALQYPEETALATAIPMRWSADVILKPLIVLLNGSGALFLRLLGIEYTGEHKHVHSPEEILLLIGQSHEGGLLDAEERQLLDNALRVRELTVGEIAVPRVRMVAAEVNTPPAELLKLAVKTGVTRLPIYEETIDTIIGFVHLRDLFQLYYTKKEAPTRSIVRKIPFLPETMTVSEAWTALDRERSYLAIVLDEYGGTAGMITREDLMEEIFGELQDEFDAEKPSIAPVGDRQYLVQGDEAVEHLNHWLHLDLSTEEANTIGGLIVSALGRLPEVGDTVTFDGVEIRVQTVVRHAVGTALITLLPPADEEGEAE